MTRTSPQMTLALVCAAPPDVPVTLAARILAVLADGAPRTTRQIVEALGENGRGSGVRFASPLRSLERRGLVELRWGEWQITPAGLASLGGEKEAPCEHTETLADQPPTSEPPTVSSCIARAPGRSSGSRTLELWTRAGEVVPIAVDAAGNVTAPRPLTAQEQDTVRAHLAP